MSSASTSGVYGGDEINAIVLDAGSYTTRVGYAGDDFPKVIELSVYQKAPTKNVFGGGVELPRSGLELIPIMKDSMIDDWEGALAMYKYIFNDVLAIDYQEQPILITEPVWTSKEYRQRLVETFYEEFDFPALYLARSPACVSFQQGRLTCLVVDIGHDQVSVLPVVDGICLLRNSMKTNYGGHYLNDLVHDTLESTYPGLSLVPGFKVKSKTPTVYPESAIFEPRAVPDGITKLFESYQQDKMFAEFKELLLEVPEKSVSSNPAPEYIDDDVKRSMEFPAGQSVEVLLDRFRLADAVFDPESYPFHSQALLDKYPSNNGELDISSPYDDYRPVKRAKKNDSLQTTPTPAPESDGEAIRGLTLLISHAIASVDIDLRTSIAHNIVVTGGTSLIPQLTDRLHTELLNANPGLKVRLHALGNANERTNQAWIGGSVLASLGTFHQMWVTRAEYDEAGVERMFTQRFR